MIEPIFASRRELFDAHRALLDQLARAWLDAGATGFAIWCDDAPAIAWQADARAGIRAPIENIGELRVSGINAPNAAQRLHADAALIARALELENNLEQMTGELVETQDQLLALYDLTRATRSMLDVRELIETACLAAARLVNTAAGVGWVALGNDQFIIAQQPRAAFADDFLAALFKQLRPLERATALDANDPMVSRVIARATVFEWGRANLHNLIFVPISVRGVRAAGIGLLNKISGRFASPDLKLASAIAEQIGALIESALLYQETLRQAKLQNELDLAARIQLGLLPRATPTIAGLDIYSCSRPASQVGGDFFDHLIRPDQLFDFTVGDVAGKGVSAALLMATAFTIIRSATRFMPSPNPAAILRRVNVDLYDELSDLGMFITVFRGQYDRATRELTYANAGHAPVLYCPVGEPARLLIADGTALGILPTGDWQNYTLNFGVGDVLLIATDGFSDARNTREDMFGYERLLRLLETSRHLSAREIGARLFDAINTFSNARAQDDDQTMIVLEGVA
jgi:sigma-B regulation protein RsbU (phosphoserine phosphatase)